MNNQNAFDSMPIRQRLEQLKIDSGMDAIEFCKIYAPERCEKSDANTRNYISQVFSGGTSINNKPVPILLEHLLNIVNSDKFPGVTLDYLVYGDETPAKTFKKLELDPAHWTLADFCEFIGNLKRVYPYSIKGETITVDEPYTLEGQEELVRNSYYSLKFLEYAGFADSGYDLGGAVRACFTEYEKMNPIPSEEVRTALFKKIVESIRSDARFAHPLLSSTVDADNFYECEEYGQEFKGLSLE